MNSKIVGGEMETTATGPLFYDDTPVRDAAELASSYPETQFNSRTRSTVPLLALVKDRPDLLRDLLATCGLEPDAALHFEYQVQSPRGRGKASHTDLMVIGKTGCMAIEAKWTEPASETVAAWLGSETENRREVLNGWLDLIGKAAGRTPAIDEAKAVTYQTVHRAASACHVGPAPQLAYLQFVSDATSAAALLEKRRADLLLLRSILGNGPFPVLRLIEVAIAPTAAFQALEPLGRGAPAAPAIQKGLVEQSLFRFERMSVRALL